MVRPIKIISGGQTGVDRAALDVALMLKIPHGGWCPKGRKAEDGVIPERYRLTETRTKHYQERTRLNVLDSDQTLILTSGVPTGGTLYTLRCCKTLDADFKVVDPANPEDIKNWLKAGVLNVAGPRKCEAPTLYQQAYQYLLDQFGD